MFPLVFSPGPANIIAAIAGARYGLIRSIPVLLGIDLVYLLYALLLGFGARTLFGSYPQTLVVIKYLGAAYIIFLSYKMFTSERNLDDRKGGSDLRFIDGVFLQALNPKFPIILAIMFTTFLDPREPNSLQVFVLSFSILALNVFTQIVWATAGHWITNTFTSKRNVYIQNSVFCLMLVAVAIWIAVRD